MNIKTFNKRAAILCVGIWSGLALLAACGKEDTSKQPMPSFELAKKQPDLSRGDYEHALKIRKLKITHDTLTNDADIQAFVKANPEYLQTTEEWYKDFHYNAEECADKINQRFGIPQNEAREGCWQSFDIISISNTSTDRYNKALNTLGQYLLEGK